MAPGLCVIESLDGETVTAMVAECLFCGRPAAVRNIPAQPFARWYNGGEAVQDALPMLSDDEREILATGSHGHCFDGAATETAP